MSIRWKAAFGGALIGGASLALTATPSSAQMPMEPPITSPQAPMTHEQMHQMMDAMHGGGSSDRMHEAMGPDSEKLMDQCTAMMSMMQMMPGATNRSMPGMSMGR